MTIRSKFWPIVSSLVALGSLLGVAVWKRGDKREPCHVPLQKDDGAGRSFPASTQLPVPRLSPALDPKGQELPVVLLGSQPGLGLFDPEFDPLEVAVFADGRLVFTRHVEAGKPPVRLETQVDPERVQSLLNAIQASGAFGDGNVTFNHQVPDGIYTVLALRLADRTITTRTLFGGAESPKSMVAEGGIVVLGRTSREAVLAGESEGFQRARAFHKLVIDTLRSWVPTTGGKPFGGKIEMVE